MSHLACLRSYVNSLPTLCRGSQYFVKTESIVFMRAMLRTGQWLRWHADDHLPIPQLFVRLVPMGIVPKLGLQLFMTCFIREIAEKMFQVYIVDSFPL